MHLFIELPGAAKRTPFLAEKEEVHRESPQGWPCPMQRALITGTALCQIIKVRHVEDGQQDGRGYLRTSTASKNKDPRKQLSRARLTACSSFPGTSDTYQPCFSPLVLKTWKAHRNYLVESHTAGCGVYNLWFRTRAPRIPYATVPRAGDSGSCCPTLQICIPLPCSLLHGHAGDEWPLLARGASWP